MKMMRAVAIAVLTVAAIGLTSATGALAHGGGGHGGGGGYGGWHGGGFGWGPGWGWGYYPYGPYNYGACYNVRQRVKTRHGWRVRLVSVCQ